MRINVDLMKITVHSTSIVTVDIYEMPWTQRTPHYDFINPIKFGVRKAKTKRNVKRVKRIKKIIKRRQQKGS